MNKKVTGSLFPRKRYTGGTTPAVYFPHDRLKLARLLGGAVRVHLHVRLYDRSSAGAPLLDVSFFEGCIDDELPREGVRQFTVAPSVQVPAAPWNTTNLGAPDDGRLTVSPTFGLLDTALTVSGTANIWMEFEVWYTAEYAV